MPGSLGYRTSLSRRPRQDKKGKYQLVVSDKSWDKLKQNLKTITRKKYDQWKRQYQRR
jgi:hypothetical protein